MIIFMARNPHLPQGPCLVGVVTAGPGHCPRTASPRPHYPCAAARRPVGAVAASLGPNARRLRGTAAEGSRSRAEPVGAAVLSGSYGKLTPCSAAERLSFCPFSVHFPGLSP